MQGPTTDKTEKLFDSIAPTYDTLNHLLSLGIDRGWRRKSLRWVVDRHRPQQILDIACGTGDYAIAIARHAHPQTKVHGLDLTEAMLQVMRCKVERLRLSHCITAEQGNAEHLPFATASFDCATIAFGIRNFEHREQALCEILRVLRPGGRLVILELSTPTIPIVRGCYRFYFTKLLPLIGGWISGSRHAYRYLPASVLAFPEKSEWMKVMLSCGYRNVSHRAFTLGICRMYIGEK
ncbi:MAG: bifunctional demethylmenaquinone methyltransferase/2-methoxy-6-polyprenyl-1,4-benzoquinol methylase UbiE [Bacteroidales bacterium]|nr:bifunctional demethylmenaquinone methyltransferase/2-methoxy-6-polyprenyl-1,4-benzoquinol methylase UbiE [Bacteroidales bacterium]